MTPACRRRGPAALIAFATAGVLAVATGAVAPVVAQPGSADWSSQNVDLGNSRYAPLDQIDTGNVARLTMRWSFETGPTDNIAQATPVVIDGVMYLHSRATLFALNAATGEELWTASLTAGPEGGSPVRGPTFADGRIYAYRGADLYAMDADTGAPVESFGNQGVLPVVSSALQLKYPDDFPPTLDPVSIGYRITTPPAYHDGTLYVAAALSEGHIPGGLVIATDADTGAIAWVFNTVPQGPQDAGWEIARDTWGAGARAGGGIWTQPAIDPDLGLVYVNAGNPSPDYDGSARVGKNLFSNSTIALVVNPVGDTVESGPGSPGHTESISDLDRISEDYPPSVTVSAYDPVTGEQKWQQVLPARSSIGASGNMVTAGNLVFQGVEDGGFYALDAETGAELFRFDAPRPIRASPLTYQVNGTQYVTVVATNTVVTLALP